MIPPTINTHIDCQKNSKSVFGALSKQQQGALKVCCASYSVSMNCCQHYMLHINQHILYIYFIKFNFNLKEVQESNNYFKSYQVNKRVATPALTTVIGLDDNNNITNDH